ncbi:porin [Arthrobacter sp. Leaf141]|uniref:MIP/aquaporin family protein n=1 Tax=Micrococcaceae TaxID=1268 RepID=UPI0006832B2E|nr:MULTISPECIES: aquaporin [Micrococcaceae]KQR03426.1 porin [Arthrobacter sp. Leaf141]
MRTPAPARSDTRQPDAAGESQQGGLLPRLAAEAFGSLFITVVALGVPLFSIPQTSPLPSALAAGLAITAAMIAFGHVSGGHFNPAITVGHLLAGRIRAGRSAAYVAAQLAGALVGALALFGVLSTLPGIQDSRTAFATVTAGFAEHSIVQAPLGAVLLLELLGSIIIVAVFLGAGSRANTARAAAPVAVGLAFAALLQLGQTLGNLPFNPARALASAVFSPGWAVEQVWVFLLMPLVGGTIAGLLFRVFDSAAASTPVAAIDGGDPAADTADDVAAAGGRSGVDGQDDGGFRDAADGGDASAVDGFLPESEPSRQGPAGAAATPSASTDEAREFFDGKRG